MGMHCAASVRPVEHDAASVDVNAVNDAPATPEASVPADVAITCLATRPAFGSQCPARGARCDYVERCYDTLETFACNCEAAPTTSALQWICGACEGPLPPPDLAA